MAHRDPALPRDNQVGSPVPWIPRNRLPTLFEVLSRNTRPPVDLFSFYIYMRDQQRSVDYLDFWLDVAQHMSLCRHYVRELRRSVLVGTPDMEKGESKRSSRALEAMGDIPSGPVTGTEKEREQNAQMSAFLRDQPAPGANLNDSPQSSQERVRARASTQLSSMSTPLGLTSDSNSPNNAVSREDIRASAERILYTYLLPGAEREITLPGSITADITTAIEHDGRDDPEVFDLAKDYVFQAMERDAFPGFLRARAFGNLIPPTIIARLILGLIALFGGFWTAFVLIFLNYPRAARCWVILPFTVGVYLLASYQYNLDPVMALVGFTEYTPFQYQKIAEPYVRKLLIKRALTVLALTNLVDAAISVLFIFVPGKRL